MVHYNLHLLRDRFDFRGSFFTVYLSLIWITYVEASNIEKSLANVLYIAQKMRYGEKARLGYKIFYKRSNHEEPFRAVKINHKNLVK